jgi:hypothetical protein
VFKNKGIPDGHHLPVKTWEEAKDFLPKDCGVAIIHTTLRKLIEWVKGLPLLPPYQSRLLL